MEFPELPEVSVDQRKGLAIVAIAALVIGLFYVYLARGHVVSASAATPKPSTTSLMKVISSSPSPRPSILSVVVVDVAGKVKNPGVYSLPTGSRAVDALKAAGNALPGIDLTNINLAEILIDGEQIIVGPVAVSASSSLRSKTSASQSSGPIRINTATVADFDTLPGIGPVIAQRIVDYRKKHGAFISITDLQKVSGMGSAKFNGIKARINL